MTSRRRGMRPPGFQMIEMMFFISMLAVFLLLVSHLFIQTVGLHKQTMTVERDISAARDMTRWLERDVWAAQSVGVEADAAVIQAPGQAAVRWTVRTGPPTDDHAWHIQRTAAGDTRGWMLPAEVAFTPAGPGMLTLTVGGNQVTLVSQLKRFEGVTP